MYLSAIPPRSSWDSASKRILARNRSANRPCRHPIADPSFLQFSFESRGRRMNATTKSKMSFSLTTLPRIGVKQRLHAKREKGDCCLVCRLNYYCFFTRFPLTLVFLPPFLLLFLFYGVCAFAVPTRILPLHPCLSISLTDVIFPSSTMCLCDNPSTSCRRSPKLFCGIARNKILMRCCPPSRPILRRELRKNQSAPLCAQSILPTS